jgi:hypothetical protein
MSSWSIFDSDGRKTVQFYGREKDCDLNVPAGGAKVAGDFDGDAEFFDGASVVSRPTLPVPVAQTVAAGADWTLTGIPAGTEIYTDGELVGTADGNDVDLTFPSAQVWTVEFVPPFPHQVASTEVTVT